MQAAITLSNLSTGYGSKTLVHDVNLEVTAGGILNILGPNGVGKTTLLKAITGLHRPLSGTVSLFGQALHTISIPQRGKHIALVSQSEVITFALSVIDTVLTGRAAHLGMFGRPSRHDRELAMAMLDEMGIVDLADQEMPSLSGGQRQMVRIARALAQEAPIMVLDEPTSHLDIANQMQVLAAIMRLKRRGITIVITTHDPEHALVCGGELLALQRDAKPILGKTDAILSEDLIELVFKTPVVKHITSDSDIIIAPRYRQILKDISQ